MARPSSPRPGSTPVDYRMTVDAVQILMAAARLRRSSYLWDLKKKAMSSGTDVMFFVDNDIVKLFTNPGEMGPVGDRPGAEGYGSIFPGDSDAEATDVAALLGEHIFGEIGERPMLQFSSHAEELGIILDTVARDALVKPDWSQPVEAMSMEQTDRFIEEVATRSGTAIDSASVILYEMAQGFEFEEFEKAASKLLDTLLAPHNASLELTRFLQLLSNEQIVPLDQIGSERLETFGPKWPKILAGPTTLAEMIDLSRATDFWLKRLELHKRSNASIESIDRDARALAYLEFINERARPHDCMACLITGDLAIWRLGRMYVKTGLSDWLVHPRAFVIDALDAWGEGNADGAFRVAVQGLLTPFDLDTISKLSRGESESKKQLTGQLESARPDAAAIYRQNFEQWDVVKRSYLSGRIVSGGSYGELIRKFLRSISGRSLKEVTESLDDLCESFDAAVRDEWRKLELGFSEIGVNLLLSFRDSGARRRWRPRNPPILMFDHFDRTDELARMLLSERAGSANVAAKLREIGGEGATDFEKRYLTFLVYAILAAAEGRWHIAKVFASRSVAIADTLREEGGGTPLDGREALFMSAQAERCLARDLQSIWRARETLTKARLLVPPPADDPHEQLKLLRFENEDIAIDVAELHFRTWIAGDAISAAELAFVTDRVQSFLRDLRQCEPTTPRDLKLKDTLGSLAFINTCQLLHLAERHSLEIEARLSEVARLLWVRYGPYLTADNNDRYHISYLMASYISYFEYRNSGRRKGSTKELSDRKNVAKYSLAIYDRMRFKDLFVRMGRRAS